MLLNILFRYYISFMRAFLISDTHLGIHRLKSDYWLYDVTKKYFDDFFIPNILKLKKDGDIILHLGDYFDDRSSISVNVLDYGIELLKNLQEIMPVHLLLGNHDLYTEKSLDIHSLRWSKLLPNVTLYEKPELLTFDQQTCLMMPWTISTENEIKILDSFKANYVFCHSDLKGAKNNQLTEMKHGIDVKHFQKYRQVYSGHIHLKQKINNFQFIGCPYHLDRNDKMDQKGIWIIDFETNKTEFIPNTYSPEYRTLIIDKESDLIKMDKLDFNKDRIDLKISNKLVIENKKVRSQIEKMVQERQFEGVEWKDDLKLENLIEEEDLQFDQSNQEFNFNIKTLTYEYINRQEFENTAFKDKAVEIVDQTFEIWEQQKNNG